MSQVTHLVPSVSSHGQKMSQMTQFYILTHFDVLCVGEAKNIRKRKKQKQKEKTKQNELIS